jgi:hypothetical protein
MGYANEWKLDVSLNQVVEWNVPSQNVLLKKAMDAIREKLKGKDNILRTSFVFKFDCIKPECQLDYADVEPPEIDWAKLGENFDFSTDAGADKEAKEVIASVRAAFSEHFEKPRATYKIEKDGSSCVILHIGVRIKRQLEGHVTVKVGGRDVELFGGKDPPTELFVEGRIKICCCVCEEVGEEAPGGDKKPPAEKTPTGLVSKCDYSVTVRRWDEQPAPVGAAHELYWECSAPLGSCGKTKKIGPIPLTTLESGMPKK